MSERTPSLSTIRHAWAKAHPFPLTTDVEERYAEFDRAIAAHDAEKRAEWEAEQGEVEWEYGTALRAPNGTLWDFEFEGTREAAEWHVHACKNDGHDHGMDECVIVRRTPRVSAGSWVPVNENGSE